MQPDQQAAFGRALSLGPGHCPPELLAGSVEGIVNGLKVHSATVTKARLSALESTFPRTRSLLGVNAFSERCSAYLAQEQVLGLPLNLLGSRFPGVLAGESAFLSKIEWAWLEAYGAEDAPAVGLRDFAELDPTAVADCRVRIHPAARLVVADSPRGVSFDSVHLQSAAVLITRPEFDVNVIGAPATSADFLAFLGRGRRLGSLLDRDFQLTAFLLTHGALMRANGDSPCLHSRHC